jgi:GH43 family beta-xylosidase
MFPTEEWEDIGAIDGTLLRHGGVQYFVYVRFPTIWISKMTDPVTAVRAGTVLLREPTRPWEGGTNEGPFFIYNKNVSYMVFAIGGSFDPSYGLGLMSIDEGKDPMVPENWWYGPDEAVFWKNEEEKVLGPGHAAFTTSPDKTETWFVYHAHENDGKAGGHRFNNNITNK